jgi:tight adherence protein C
MQPEVQLESIARGEFVIWVAYVLIGVGAYIVARMLVAEQESRAAQENLADLRDRKASNGLVKLTRPFFTQYVVPMIRGKPFWDNKRKHYKRKIISAGLKDELTPDEFIAFKLFLIIFFPVVGGFLKAGDFIDLQWYYILASGIVGWFYPDMWVKGRIEDRQKKIMRAMPFIIDLLALSTEAGLDFVGAIGKVVEKATPSPLVEEFGQLLKEIKVGASRQEALREMGARINMTEINSFIAILISADQMGASIGKILRQQSEQIRVDRMLRAEKAGAAATQKLMLPIMMFIVPAVFIMIMAPVALEFIYPPPGR